MVTATIVATAIRIEKPKPRASPAIITAVSSIRMSGEFQPPVATIAHRLRPTSNNTFASERTSLA